MQSTDPTPTRRPFTGMALDRASTERKDPARIEQLLRDPGARAVSASGEGVLIGDGARPALIRTPLRSDDGREPILLGLDNGTALFALDLDALPATTRDEMTDGGRIVALREAGSELPHAEAGLAAYLSALLGWHRKHRFCSNCGAATAVHEAGYLRHCARCGTDHFPRTDPVVIMTVEHEGRLLLGRRAGWPTGRLSVLAGFVSPGESAEEAVVREVREESGIVARDPVYVASQPWPFPSSLMLGFAARAHGGQPSARDGELEDVRWFGEDEVRAALAGAHPELRLPPPVSIARFLIERWVAGRDSGG